MSTVQYLLQLFGAYFILNAIFFTFFQKRMMESISSIVKEDALLRMSGFFSIFGGLAVLLAFMQVRHDLTIAAQLIGLFLLISGIMRVLFYNRAKSVITKILGKKYHVFYVVFLWIVGLLLVAFSCK